MKTLTNRELREQRKDVLRQMQDLQSGGRFDQKKFDQLDTQFRTLTASLEELESRSMGQIRGGQPDGGFATPTMSYENGTRRQENPEHRKAFHSYLRLGSADMPQEERSLLLKEHRDMGVGVAGGAYPGSSGGFFTPVGFVNRIEDSLKYYGCMLDGGPSMPTIMDTATGQVLPYPAVDDTASVGEQIGEGQQVNTADVNVQQVLFGAWKYSTKMCKVSIELIQDSAFDIENFLIQEFSRRMGRILNTKLTIGAGTTEPLGILTAIVNGGNVVSAVGSSGNDGSSASTNTIGTNDLTALEHSVDPIYRNMGRCQYMMHDTTLRSIKQLKNKFGNPIFQESMRDGQPATINGYRFCVNNDLDALQVNPSSPPAVKHTMIFGDLTKYVVRRVREMSILRLNERFADQALVAFIGFSRYDGNSLDIGHRALAALQNVY